MKKNFKKLLAAALIAVAGSTVVFAYDNTNILVEEAVNHIYQQRYQNAHAVLKEAYEQSPRHPGVHFNLGRLFELTGNFNEALKEYRLASSLDTSMVAARRGIARCVVELKRVRVVQAQKRNNEATQPGVTSQTGAVKQVVQSYAPSRIVTQTPARTYSLNNNIQETVRQPVQQPQIIQAQQPRPRIIKQTQQQSYQPIKPAAKIVAQGSTEKLRLPQLPSTPMQQVSQPTQRSYEETLLDSGKINEAIIAIDNLLKKNPDSPTAHFLMGKAMSVKGELFNSIKHLEESLRVDKNFYDSYYLLGRNYAKVNLLEDAIKNYQFYYAVKPQASVALEIARIYESMGNPAKAKEFYSRANAMNPGNPNLQMRLSETTGNLANELYLRANHSFTMENYDESVSLFSQAIETSGLQENYRRDALRKIEVARFKIKEIQNQKLPATRGFNATRKNFGTVNLQYYQLADINFKTRFTGAITVEWHGMIAKKISRYGKDFLLMIKELSRDELDAMNRDRNSYRLNQHYNNQPVFLIAAQKGGFPPFAREGKMITFTGTTDWRRYNIINEMGQTVSLPAFEFVSAYPDQQ